MRTAKRKRRSGTVVSFFLSFFFGGPKWVQGFAGLRAGEPKGAERAGARGRALLVEAASFLVRRPEHLVALF